MQQSDFARLNKWKSSDFCQKIFYSIYRVKFKCYCQKSYRNV